MSAQDYPITTPFGWVLGYPLNRTDPNRPGYGFHNGIDYGCPTGTPVVVNGVPIGLSGSTGYVTGAHLHVGRWVNGQVTDPKVGGGFSFKSAKVTEAGSDATNGNFVRIQGDGASWVYLHLSKQSVKVGQVLKEEEMIAWNKDNTYNFLNETLGKKYADKAKASNYWHELADPNKPLERGTAVFAIIRSAQYKSWMAEVKAGTTAPVVLKPNTLYKTQ